MAALTPEQFSAKLDRFAKGLPKAMSRASFLAAQQLNADIKGRIFRVGGSKDTGGNTRGYLSASYRTKRKKAGLQANKVDHVFKGDLQRSIKLFQEPKEVELRIVGDLNVKKARGNEDLYPTESVFAASKKEAKIAGQVFEEAIADYIQTIF